MFILLLYIQEVHVKAIFALQMKWRLVEESGPHCFEEIEEMLIGMQKNYDR